jgi:hypothetical protein
MEHEVIELFVRLKSMLACIGHQCWTTWYCFSMHIPLHIINIRDTDQKQREQNYSETIKQIKT